VSLIVSAFAPCDDIRQTWTPQLRTDAGPTSLVLIDLANGRTRLGGSVLAQVYNETGDQAPDVDDPAVIRGLFDALAELRRSCRVLAYHDRSDGGLFVTLCEMAFAGHAGVTVDAAALCEADSQVVAALFTEELGAVVQVRDADIDTVLGVLAARGLEARAVARVADDDQVRVLRGSEVLFGDSRIALHRAWSETTWQLQSLRDNPESARQEYDRVLDAGDPGISPVVAFDAAEDVAAPFIAAGARPPMAILRDQGVNGEVEMAAAFDRAGFEAHDVHVSDIIEGRVSLASFRGFAACGGFSYGDVLGGGEGWAKSILYNPRARDEFAAFFSRPDTFALGVCNGCQMMAALKELVPGAQAWPRFVKNTSEQFEARLSTMEILESPSLFFAGMAGSRLPVVTAHGEGRALFERPGDEASVVVVGRFVNNLGRPTEIYPLNPNGSAGGLTAVTTADGRFTALMPHPERVFRTVQLSWHPDGWGEDSPWMRLFRNARAFVG
jgi:phosphoribosylformylglycinamidine synthase